MTDRPSTTYRDIELPPAVAEQLQTAFGLPESPTTLGEWVTITSDVADEIGLTNMDALCADETSRHQATIESETQHFYCVLDALVVPFLLDIDEPISIRARVQSPGPSSSYRPAETRLPSNRRTL